MKSSLLQLKAFEQVLLVPRPLFQNPCSVDRPVCHLTSAYHLFYLSQQSNAQAEMKVYTGTGGWARMLWLWKRWKRMKSHCLVQDRHIYRSFMTRVSRYDHCSSTFQVGAGHGPWLLISDSVCDSLTYSSHCSEHCGPIPDVSADRQQGARWSRPYNRTISP